MTSIDLLARGSSEGKGRNLLNGKSDTADLQGQSVAKLTAKITCY
jgi:hypothetical protein